MNIILNYIKFYLNFTNCGKNGGKNYTLFNIIQILLLLYIFIYAKHLLYMFI